MCRTHSAMSCAARKGERREEEGKKREKGRGGEGKIGNLCLETGLGNATHPSWGFTRFILILKVLRQTRVKKKKEIHLCLNLYNPAFPKMIAFRAPINVLQSSGVHLETLSLSVWIPKSY